LLCFYIAECVFIFIADLRPTTLLETLIANSKNSLRANGKKKEVRFGTICILILVSGLPWAGFHSEEALQKQIMALSAVTQSIYLMIVGQAKFFA
jgi:hypothetical protein